MSLGATAIAVSVIITAAELLAGGERANRKGLRGWSWYCMSKMVQVCVSCVVGRLVVTLSVDCLCRVSACGVFKEGGKGRAYRLEELVLSIKTK